MRRGLLVGRLTLVVLGVVACVGPSSALAVTDNVPPTVSITNPTPNQHFFQNQVVNASFSCADNIGGSGIKNCTGSSQVNTSTVGTHVFTVTATDNANNTTQGNVTYIVDPPDTVAPTATITTPAEGQHFAQNSTVFPVFSCADNPGGIGIASCNGPSVVDTSTQGPHTFTVVATDAAGNQGTAVANYVVDPPDVTAPVITITRPTSGQHFQHNDAVAPIFSCSDTGGSGVTSCSGPSTIDTSTIGAHTFTVTATDAAGNASSASIDYVVDPDDTTPPTISITTPAGGQHFAQGAAVASAFTCADEAGGSGLVSCSGPATIDTAAPGAHTFKVTAIDHSGNATTASVAYVVDPAPVTPDTTAPTITISRPLPNQHFVQGASILAGFTCVDNPAGSGVASCTGPVTVDTSTVGAHTMTVTAKDVAGNTSTAAVNYVVDKFVITPTLPAPGTITKSDRVVTALKALYRSTSLTLTKGYTRTLTFNAPFAGVLTVRWSHGKTPIAAGSVRFGQAGTKTLKLKIYKAGKRLLKASKTHKLSITSRATFAPDSGGPHSRTKQLTIKSHK